MLYGYCPEGRGGKNGEEEKEVQRSTSPVGGSGNHPSQFSEGAADPGIGGLERGPGCVPSAGVPRPIKNFQIGLSFPQDPWMM